MTSFADDAVRFTPLVTAVVARWTGAGCVATAQTVGGLHTAAGVIRAGGGPRAFKTLTLIETLAGPNAGYEMAELTRRFGAADVKSFLVSFDFVVADARTILTRRKIALPLTPASDGEDAKALSAALYAAGVDPLTRRFDVDIMLDRVFTRGIDRETMRDVNVAYGAHAATTYRAVLGQLVVRLHTLHGP